MRYGINARFLLDGKLEGIGWFSYETLKRITQSHPEHEFVFFFDRPYHKKFVFAENVRPVVLFPPARHPFLYFIFFELSVAWAIRKYKIDRFISPDGFIPTFSRAAKSIAVIHDINFEHRPQDFSLLNLWYNKIFFRRFAKQATQLATVSNYSKNDIVQSYQIDPAKISVVYNGSNEQYVPLSKAEQEVTRLEFSNGEEYFLYVGSLNPRKNISGLLRAYDRFKSISGSRMKLVMVGKVMHGNNFFEPTLNSMQFRDDVLFLGHLDVDALHRVLGTAFALSYVPYFEGFGIPLIEAMNCDVPIITSNVTSLPEVAGNAALFVDPNSIESIAEAMLNLYNNPTLRFELIEKGRSQRLKFSWNLTSEFFWNAILKLEE
jgi:glycosyltransferase involved in cell wall biosynthesis